MSSVTHSQDRAKERYDEDIVLADLIELTLLIKDKKAVCLSSHRSRGVYMVRYRDKIWKVVYDEIDQRILTVLPPSGKLREKGKRYTKKMESKNMRRKKNARAMRAAARDNDETIYYLH